MSQQTAPIPCPDCGHAADDYCALECKTQIRQMAVVREVDGQLVLDDPMAMGMITAVNKRNCRNTMDMNWDRITHFAKRMKETNRDPKEFLIVILNVDDRNGGAIAEVLMPGHDWQAVRDTGAVPFARGLAGREGIQEILNEIDREEAVKLAAEPGLPIVIVDHGTTLVWNYVKWDHDEEEADEPASPAAD
jgi:hypothetical protein